MVPSPYKLAATQVLALLKNNTMTVETYTSSLSGRTNENDGTVKAWAHLNPGYVLNQALALDQAPKDQRGPLHGLAIGVKDIIDTKDMPTQYSSPIYRGHRPSSDSSAVAILRAAGALIFSKTTTTEFAITNSSPQTTNPHDPNRTPGGLSCGSAAAVADLQVTLSLGSQTGGSLIRPASFTGVFAMKPTFNAISTAGQKPFAPSFDTFCFFARSIEDLQLVADVFSLQDDEPPRDIPLNDITVALIKTPFWPSAGPGIVSAIETAATILRKNDVKVDQVSFPQEVADVKCLKRIQEVITRGEAQVSFLREYRVDKANLAPKIRDMVENTSNTTHKEMMGAYDAYAKMRDIVNDLAKNYTVILTPSAVDEAPLGLDDMGSADFNTLWTASGPWSLCALLTQEQGFHMPVINIPAFVGENGMPVGISLVSPRFRDQQLLRTSKALSEALLAHNNCRARV